MAIYDSSLALADVAVATNAALAARRISISRANAAMQAELKLIDDEQAKRLKLVKARLRVGTITADEKPVYIQAINEL